MGSDTEEKIFQMHAEVCKSMANPTRLKILNLLQRGEKSVEELRKQLKLPKANLSQHLSILRQCRVLVARREGLNVYYKCANQKMLKACEILREVLMEQLAEGGRLGKWINKGKK